MIQSMTFTLSLYLLSYGYATVSLERKEKEYTVYQSARLQKNVKASMYSREEKDYKIHKMIDRYETERGSTS
jgi:hypothetical protein